MRPRVAEEEPKPANLPSLGVALDYWVTHRKMTLLEDRARILNNAQIPAGFLGRLYRNAQLFGGGVAILEHEASLSAGNKEGIIKREIDEIRRQTGSDQIPKVLKTVTLGFGSGEETRYVLVAMIGDRNISDEEKIKIGRVAGMSPKVSKRGKFNSGMIPPELLVGLPAGIVGPFLGVQTDSSLLGIAYSTQREGQGGLVAVAASFWETLITRESTFFLAMGNWHSEKSRRLFLKPFSVD